MQHQAHAHSCSSGGGGGGDSSSRASPCSRRCSGATAAVAAGEGRSSDDVAATDAGQPGADQDWPVDLPERPQRRGTTCGQLQAHNAALTACVSKRMLPEEPVRGRSVSWMLCLHLCRA